MNGRYKVIGAVAVLLVVAGAGVRYWQKKSSAPASQPISQAQPASQAQADQKAVDISLGSQILQKTQNPLKGKLPPTNPFEKAETNPLQGVYQNPF